MRSLPWVVAAVLLLLVPACGDPEADVAGEGARRTADDNDGQRQQ